MQLSRASCGLSHLAKELHLGRTAERPGTIYLRISKRHSPDPARGPERTVTNSPRPLRLAERTPSYPRGEPPETDGCQH
jgi:hypothetical protein